MHQSICFVRVPCLALLILSGLNGAAAQASIIDDVYGAGAGSFELGNHNGAAFQSLAPNSTAIGGWTVGGPGNGIDWLNSTHFGVHDGTKAVDLKGFTNSSISTIIPTHWGKHYEVSFWVAAVEGHDNEGFLHIASGSIFYQEFAAPFSETFATQSFTKLTYQFTATSDIATIVFGATGNLSPSDALYGPVLDAVSVEEVPFSEVPEPASALVWSIVLVGGVLSTRRRRSMVRT